MNVIGIFDGRWSPPDESNRGYYARFQRARWYKANPRDRDYMQQLFTTFYPHGKFLDVQQDHGWKRYLEQADEVVLLYPDSIGLGFVATQRDILSLSHPAQNISVLNGRRRHFRLDRPARRQLLWRRFLERWMVGEFLLIPVMLTVTLALALNDYLGAGRGGSK